MGMSVGLCGWAKTPGTARAAILRNMAAEILRRKPELCALEMELGRCRLTPS